MPLFYKKGSPFFSSLLIEQLAKQDELEMYSCMQEGSENLSISSATCLGLIAQCIRNEILGLVLPYIQNNMKKQDGPEAWRQREAATTAFGAIIKGPDLLHMKSLLTNGLEDLLIMLQDQHPMVRNSAAFTISRALEFVHTPNISFIQPQKNLSKILISLTQRIDDEPQIASRVCKAIMHLVEGFEKNNGVLQPYFQSILAQMLNVAIRTGNDNMTLKLSSYEAINEMVRHSPEDCISIVGDLLNDMINKLQETLNTFSSSIESIDLGQNQIDSLGYICGVIQVTLQKLSEEQAIHVVETKLSPNSDNLMHLMLLVLSLPNSDIQKEALLAVSAFTYIAKKDFTKYMQHPTFYPLLDTCLKKHQDSQLCLSAVGILGDICLAIGSDINPYVNLIMLSLNEIYTSCMVDRAIKPLILTTFGDIAMATSEHFMPYANYVIQLLTSSMSVNDISRSSDEDYLEYNCKLMNGIFEAFSGILYCVEPSVISDQISSVVPGILTSTLLTTKQIDKSFFYRDINLLKNSLGLILDVSNRVIGAKELFMKVPDLSMIVIKIYHNSNYPDKCRETAHKIVSTISNTI
jgi:importin subunit beta-1